MEENIQAVKEMKVQKLEYRGHIEKKVQTGIDSTVFSNSCPK